MTKLIHVLAGVLINAEGKVLITERLPNSHLAGCWEFPGGKRELGETAEQALRRELREEIGIEVKQARPLIRVYHAYPEKRILLEVWQILDWQGNPSGQEAQALCWQTLENLKPDCFPEADLPVLTALRLPAFYLITPEPTGKDFFSHLENSLAAGARLVQLRAKQLTEREYWRCAEKTLSICRRYGAKLLLNAEPRLALAIGADGAHLSSCRLRTWQAEKPAPPFLLAASCHSAAEIYLAQQKKMDFIALSPVKRTTSHLEAKPLGWRQFFALTELINCPVYALGGMERKHLNLVWAHGAQGIAAIRGLWHAID